jgi:L-ascorbate metabolism protein UlaG (beta-lactamase superfamily)
MMTLLIIMALLVAVVFIFMQQDKFGSLPNDEQLLRIKNSINYKEGKFMNESFTPDLAEGVTYNKVIRDLLFNKNVRLRPSTTLPSIKTNLHNLTIEEDVFIWFGHSSYFLQTDGKKILVDPVLSDSASPLPFSIKSFTGADIYTADDIPEIDFLFISHDHWDHLDYKTIKALKPKIKQIICGLGTGAHFEKWGFKKEIIIEKDWNKHVELRDGFKVDTIPARHFSGRGFKRNKALWLSYVLQTPTKKIFIGGDSGYDTHFKKAGDTLGPFDIAILECGQYDLSWKYIHMLPHEVLQAAKDLKAKKIIPVHWGKFKLANHYWDTPINELLTLNQQTNLNILTAMIGEKILLNEDQEFTKWWKDLK